MKLFLACFFAFLSLPAVSQNESTLCTRLGYPATTKLLIVHADDLGVSHSENDASIKSLDNLVNSASIMVPCPWFQEIAFFARQHKEKDFGLHLTLTSEWKFYKWGPVTSISSVPSLVNKNGYFYSSVDSMARFANLKEVEIELRNQIKKALQNGIDVTHLDAHMYAARNNKELLKIYVNLGREFRVPVLLTRDEKVLDSVELNSRDVVVDYLYQADQVSYDGGLSKYYTNAIKQLKPGLSCLLVHTAYDDRETRAMTNGFVYWGSLWRQQDFDFFTSANAKELIRDENIKLITWREIRDKITRK
jgi:hypothetical protein